MGCLSIKAEVDPGTMVQDACKEAQELADKVGVAVDFKFNDIHCTAMPGGDAAKLAKGFWKAADTTMPHKFAFSK